ncbi:hypothetical protein MKEN_00296300 [Mycena kentingensis (nom. inval.)]|nr:hypothetical protein MKEN_00296300 [Mycena kentingensis (nom. inval.)]
MMFSTTDPPLPLDIVREVIETSGLQSYTEIPMLMRLCHSTADGLEPLLHRRVHLISRESELVSRTPKPPDIAAQLHVLTSKSPDFIANAVRLLVVEDIQGVMESASYRALLATCTGATHLRVTLGRRWRRASPEARDTFLALLAPMRIQRLHCLVDDLWDITLSAVPALFASVTHLTMDDRLNKEELTHLAALPALTHLAVDRCHNANTINRLLDPGDFPRLRVLVLLHQPGNPVYATLTQITSKVIDKAQRFVCCKPRRADDEGVELDGGFWPVAEEFLAKKARGEVAGLFLIFSFNGGLISVQPTRTGHEGKEILPSARGAISPETRRRQRDLSSTTSIYAR